MKGKSLLRFQKWTARGSLFAGLCWIIFFSFSFMEESIPDKIWIEKGKEENFNFRLPVTGELEQEGPDTLVKTKKFPVAVMDVEEAILQMNLLGHEFFMFRSGETGEINVVYRRKDGNYGLLEPVQD